MNSGSNDIFEQNRVIFASRFPELATLMGLDKQESAASLLASIPEQYCVQEARSGSPTLSVNGMLLHSRYDPVKEAERLLAQQDSLFLRGCIFTGCGLAYLPELYALKNPDVAMVLAEPDVFVFLSCLSARRLETLLQHKNLVLAIGIPAGDVINLLEQADLFELPVQETPALMIPARSWWQEFFELKERNRKKKRINANTLRKFGHLWLGNMCRNLSHMSSLQGIEVLSGIGKDLPALVLAAGPSLDRILPYLPELSKRMLIIAVDTAVRGCVAAGVDPDFIVVVDPQYWNYRHLDSLACPESFLITESAAWPAVYRFPCKGTFLCSSLFPLGKFLEERTIEHAELGAGGSVSTSAWDFARYVGSEHIYIAGLDLGYPGKKTHFRGGLFEEWAQSVSTRLEPAETGLYGYIAQASLHAAQDYKGNTVLTDPRLELYVWWFESKIAKHPRPPTATLTHESHVIPGVTLAEPDDLLVKPEVRKEITERLSSVVLEPDPSIKERYSTAVTELMETLKDIQRLAEKGVASCMTYRRARSELEKNNALDRLNRIDRHILDHPGKEIVAMVFSFSEEAVAAKSTVDPVETTMNLYTALLDAVNMNIDGLKKSIKEN